jgi:hypothetical protein
MTRRDFNFWQLEVRCWKLGNYTHWDFKELAGLERGKERKRHGDEGHGS